MNMNFNIEKIKPKTRSELIYLIIETIKKYGHNCDLNFIDTSEITDMSFMFHKSQFNGDISNWDVSNVRHMQYMFYGSQFDGVINGWDVSNVNDMTSIFKHSKLLWQNKLPKWYGIINKIY